MRELFMERLVIVSPLSRSWACSIRLLVQPNRFRAKLGQEVIAAQGRWVSRQEIKYLVDPGHRRVQAVSPLKWGERANELVELFDRLILRKGSK
jgi:hypothetical protein